MPRHSPDEVFRMQNGNWRRPAAALALTLAVIGAGVVTAEPALGDPAAAWGAGFRDFWRAHGKQIADAAACVVEGVALSRLLALGAAGGGALAAAAVVAAAIGCMA
jgi:hypothetical protein